MLAKAVNLDGIVRVCPLSTNLLAVNSMLFFPQLSKEFQFPVASFHHAGEMYLIPDLLKKAWVCWSKPLPTY